MREIPEGVQTRANRTLSSFNAEARTVDIVLATESEVKRRSWEDGLYIEVLSTARTAIDASRLDALALLDQHDAYSGIAARLGSVVAGSLRFEGDKAIVTAKISRNAGGEALFRDLEDGHVLGASVGYRIDSFEKTDAPSGGLPTIRATRWTPLELSIVSIPADPAATTRSHEIERITKMSQQANDKQRKAADDELQRRADIEGFAKLAGLKLDDEIVRHALDGRQTTEQFRSAILDKMVADQARSPTFPHSETRGVNENRYDGLTRNQAMADALMLRINPDHKLKGASRDFVGLSLVEIARQTLETNGISARGYGAGEVVSRALHTTSDFGAVISDVGKTVVLASYAATPSALKAVGKRAVVKDFKEKTAVRLTKTGGLQKVGEHGEFKRGSFTESKESYRVETFGEIIGMTRQMLINDDLGVFADRALLLAQQATRFEAKFLVNLLKSNPVMGDGKELFHATHKNVSERATALDQTSLALGRKSFRKQTDAAGEPIGIAPKYLVVGPEQETTAEQVLAQIQPAHTGDVNVFAGKLQLIVEDRLGDSPEWYLVADPNLVPGLEFAYLDGFEGPYFEDNWGFNVDGVETKVRLDFGGGFMDWLGWYKNGGLSR